MEKCRRCSTTFDCSDLSSYSVNCKDSVLFWFGHGFTLCRACSLALVQMIRAFMPNGPWDPWGGKDRLEPTDPTFVANYLQPEDM